MARNAKPRKPHRPRPLVNPVQRAITGQRYRCVVFRDGRELVTQRARLDMDALCQRHDLYDDA